MAENVCKCGDELTTDAARRCGACVNRAQDALSAANERIATLEAERDALNDQIEPLDMAFEQVKAERDEARAACAQWCEEYCIYIKPEDNPGQPILDRLAKLERLEAAVLNPLPLIHSLIGDPARYDTYEQGRADLCAKRALLERFCKAVLEADHAK